MSNRVPRDWEELSYVDPEPVLRGLRQIASSPGFGELEYSVAALRTRELRKFGEGRQAALFTYAMGHATRRRTRFALHEAGDFDVIVRVDADDHWAYVPVQLKELVPSFLNPKASLQSEINKLGKYVDSEDLVVAIHLNRTDTIRLSELNLPAAKLAGLWLYGATEPSQQNWVVIGDLTNPNPRSVEFRYPGSD